MRRRKRGLVMQGVPRDQVLLLPHDPKWAEEFNTVKAMLLHLWQGNILDIQHIGSTAVQGICAKPILDVAVVLRSFTKLDAGALVRLGYDHCGLQPPDYTRHLFVLRGGEERLSLHHLHCYEPGDPDFARCVAFRDYLNANQADAQAYAALKTRLAKVHAGDRNAYAAAKEAFIQSIYAKL